MASDIEYPRVICPHCGSDEVTSSTCPDGYADCMSCLAPVDWATAVQLGQEGQDGA